MKNPIIFILFILLTMSFGVLALVQDKIAAVVFALVALLFMAYAQLCDKK